MGLVNDIYVNQGDAISPNLSTQSKSRLMKSINQPLRNSIGLTYSMCSSLNYNIVNENRKSNGE